MSAGELLPVVLAIGLVVAAAGFALVPLLRGERAWPAEVPAVADAAEAERFGLYKQVVELEFDYQTGKLSADDYHVLTAELLGRAGRLLRQLRGAASKVETEAKVEREAEIEREIEREIAAARSAFAAARGGRRGAARVNDAGPAPAETTRC